MRSVGILLPWNGQRMDILPLYRLTIHNRLSRCSITSSCAAKKERRGYIPLSTQSCPINHTSPCGKGKRDWGALRGDERGKRGSNNAVAQSSGRKTVSAFLVKPQCDPQFKVLVNRSISADMDYQSERRHHRSLRGQCSVRKFPCWGVRYVHMVRPMSSHELVAVHPMEDRMHDRPLISGLAPPSLRFFGGQRDHGSTPEIGVKVATLYKHAAPYDLPRSADAF